MTDGELMDYCGADAARWAAEFCKIARDHGHNIDEGWMLVWFAGSIEGGMKYVYKREMERGNMT